MRFYAPIVAAVLGNLLYHSSQRLTPQAVPPLLTVGSLSKLLWGGLRLGFAVAIIETSFLLAYRAGWLVGIAGVVVAAGQTALLLPLGYFLLGERLAPAAWAGLGLCLAGLALIGWAAKA